MSEYRASACLCTDRWQHRTNQLVGWVVQFHQLTAFSYVKTWSAVTASVAACLPAPGEFLIFQYLCFLNSDVLDFFDAIYQT